ncbi:MAG: transposase [Spirochaetaceae bacterium]|jgi:transposase|nr:transposase [Spirochaetaceae bacterium]
MIESVFRSNTGRHLVKHFRRDLTNAVLYPVKTGCQWRLLPKGYEIKTEREENMFMISRFHTLLKRF